jgi:hypothetical protein
MKALRQRLASERGDTLISGVITLILVVFVVALAIQLVAFVQARDAAQAAAQEGAQAAATEGTGVGATRAQSILNAAGGAAAGLSPTASEGTSVISVRVAGPAPHVFPGVDLLLPSISAHASAPTERYPADEEATQ